MTSLVLGSVTDNLSWDQCKYWVNSLNRSGYDGDKLIVIFGENVQLANNFKQNGFEVCTFRALTPDEHVCATRFFIYYALLQERNDRYSSILATDVSDVVFQKNPQKFLEKNSYNTLICSSENIKYKDEMWGANNMRLAFGEPAYEKVKNNTIYNAGVIGGSQNVITDLFFMIHTLCENRPQHVPGGGAPDQAAYNLLLSTDQFKSKAMFVQHHAGWACQTGTVADPFKDYSKVNIDPNPLFEKDTVKTSVTALDYFIVHQYNRNPVWKKPIEEKYS
jgi:hypothetical protein